MSKWLTAYIVPPKKTPRCGGTNSCILWHQLKLKNGPSCDHELKQLTRVEGQNNQARNVKRMLKKLGNPSTTKLYFTCDGVRTECRDKLSMEDACIAENTARFS
jgi:hypothetical protein